VAGPGPYVCVEATNRANECAAFGEKATDIFPLHLLDHVAAFDKAIVSLVDGKGLAIGVHGHADHSTHSSVHARGVTTGGHDANSSLLALEGRRNLCGSHAGVWFGLEWYGMEVEGESRGEGVRSGTDGSSKLLSVAPRRCSM